MNYRMFIGYSVVHHDHLMFYLFLYVGFSCKCQEEYRFERIVTSTGQITWTCVHCPENQVKFVYIVTWKVMMLTSFNTDIHFLSQCSLSPFV